MTDSAMWVRSEDITRAANAPGPAWGTFAARNVYFLPALMWHEIRSRIGDRVFFRLVREWPRADDDGTADYDDITTWWERESGAELTDLFQGHLLGETQPSGR